MSKTGYLDRRAALAASSLGLMATGGGALAAAPKIPAAVQASSGLAVPGAAFGLESASSLDQSDRLQAAIDQTSAKGLALALAPGRYLVGEIALRPGTLLSGAGRATVLAYNGRGSFLSAREATGLRVEMLTLDGGKLALDAARGGGLLSVVASHITMRDVELRGSAMHGILLRSSGGRIESCLIREIAGAALFSIDAAGLDVTHNSIEDADDNGILVWRSTHGEDGTLLTNNRITRIRNVSGGTGQYGNGINLYRAGSVRAANNRITDCAFTAIRANEASNVQITGNSIERIGEVALYAEAADERAGAAGFEGALIANNVVDTAAAGVAVTNFNNGGRLAVVQGNIIRNLKRREFEPRDKRGEGISIEADAVVASNVIENAATAGLVIGWGRHMREVVVTGNLIRRSRIGIAVSGDAAAGQCLIGQNMISGASEGAIRSMDHSRPTGTDLALGGKAPRHLNIAGNVVAWV